MRIAFITPEFVTENYFSGGLANYLNRVSKSLVSFGHQVHVITLSNINKCEFDYNGVNIHRVKAGNPKLWLNRLTRNRFLRTIQSLDFSWQAYRKIRILQKRHPLDLIQVPNYLACGLLTTLFSRIPVVTRISSFGPAWNELSGVKRDLDVRTIEWFELFQLILSKSIYSPSLTLKKKFKFTAGINNIQIIPTPLYLEAKDLDFSLYEKNLKGKSYLLFIGRYQLHKGYHILVKALKQVFRELEDCYAVFVGMDCSTSIAKSMKEYAILSCDKYSDRLIFFDQTQHNKLFPIIAEARIVVLPSLIDNLPNTCLESMYLSKPVIGTFGASFDEIITDGVNGFLVPPNNEGLLADKIIVSWNIPNLDEIGEAAKLKAMEFAPENTVNQLSRFYKDTINGNKF